MSEVSLPPESEPSGNTPPTPTFSGTLRMYGYPSLQLRIFPSLCVLTFACFTFQISLFAQLIDCTGFQT